LQRSRHKHKAAVTALNEKHMDAQTKTTALGRNTVRGELNEILGSFKLLNEYDQLAFVNGATSPSLDLLGVKEDRVDFIEIKSLGTGLTKSEKKVKKLIDDKKVKYVVFEGNLPKYFEINERE
jgi:predicted Holliday junction resolvase-like endonuclease